MTFSHAPWLVFTVFGLIILWLALVTYFRYYVRTRHPSEYLALGEPTYKQGAFRIISYVYRRKHRSVGDRHLSLLSDAMLVCFSLVVGFLLYAFATNGQLPGVRSGP